MFWLHSSVGDWDVSNHQMGQIKVTHDVERGPDAAQIPSSLDADFNTVLRIRTDVVQSQLYK